MSDQLEQLVDSLLYEGYALYPYTSGSAKNSTPTPFGIVYPPAYARQLTSTFDHARIECLAEPGPGATLSATLRYLVRSGERHEAAERRADLGPMPLGERATTQLPSGRFALRSEFANDGHLLVAACVHNTEDTPEALDRAAALSHSLISTHIIVRISDGRFISPLERPCESVNLYPVLATDDDDAMLGAAIVLPDHPQIAPESRGSMFDSTEIEEALRLHVLALSDAELDEIEEQDPAVKEMIARAAATSPQEITALHGRMTLRDRETSEPPAEPPGLSDPSAGEELAEVDGVTFVRGARLVIRPGPDADIHARMLDGRIATIERIFIDLDGRTHLGVTVDDDPGQELLRETGRFLFFFADEVEVMQT